MPKFKFKGKEYDTQKINAFDFPPEINCYHIMGFLLGKDTVSNQDFKDFLERRYFHAKSIFDKKCPIKAYEKIWPRYIDRVTQVYQGERFPSDEMIKFAVAYYSRMGECHLNDVSLRESVKYLMYAIFLYALHVDSKNGKISDFTIFIHGGSEIPIEFKCKKVGWRDLKPRAISKGVLAKFSALYNEKKHIFDLYKNDTEADVEYQADVQRHQQSSFGKKENFFTSPEVLVPKVNLMDESTWNVAVEFIKQQMPNFSVPGSLSSDPTDARVRYIFIGARTGELERFGMVLQQLFPNEVKDMQVNGGDGEFIITAPSLTEASKFYAFISFTDNQTRNQEVSRISRCTLV